MSLRYNTTVEADVILWKTSSKIVSFEAFKCKIFKRQQYKSIIFKFVVCPSFKANMTIIVAYFNMIFGTIICPNGELFWLFTNGSRATRYMNIKKIGITEIFRRIRLFSANKMKSSESNSKQPTQLGTQLIIAAHNCHIEL